MRKDMVFVNAVCKAKENDLLSSDALTRISSASFEDAIKMLHDYGYSDGILNEQSFDIDVFIRRQVNSLMDFISEYAPNKDVEDFLLAPYLFNDIKAEYKRKLGASQSKLYRPESVSGIVEGDYSRLCAEVAAVLRELDNVSSLSSSEIDLALTKSMYAYKLNRAKKSKSSLLIEFSKAEIDTVNIVTLRRVSKLHLKDDEASVLFLDGGNYKLNELPKKYENFDSSDTVKLETQVDNFLIELASSQSMDMDSIGPLLSYTLRKSFEIKTVKMILVCIKSNSRNEISSRLRGLQ